MKHVRLLAALLLAAFTVIAVPVLAPAAVDNASCSTADISPAACSVGNLRTSSTEEIGALSKRAPIALSSISGTNTITATAAGTNSAVITTYTNFQQFMGKPANTITGPATLNIDSVGTKPIVSQAGAALGSGDLRNDTVYVFAYYAANDEFRVIGALGTGAGAPATASFVTLGLNGSLTSERVLTEGTALDIVDGGINANVTIGFDSTELSGTTWGSGSNYTWTFNSGASDPFLTFNSGGVLLGGGVNAGDIALADESYLSFREASANGIDSKRFKAPASLTTSTTCVFEDDANFIPDSCVGDGIDDDVPEVGDFTNLVGGAGIVNNAGTLDFSSTELTNLTWGAGGGFGWAFDAGVNDPTFTFNSGWLTLFGGVSSGDIVFADRNALVLREAAANGVNFARLRAPAALTSDYTCSLEDDSSFIPDSCVGDGVDQGLITTDLDTSAEIAAIVSDETGTGALVLATSPTLVTPNLGTPSAVNLTNGTALPVSGITASTVTALGVGSVELGHATDTTLSRVSAGTAAIEGVTILTTATGQPLDSDLTAIAALTTTATGRSILGVADPNMDRVAAWDDSLGTFAAIALADITAEAAPATGDYVLLYGAEGDLRKVNWSDLPGAGAGLSAADIDTGAELRAIQTDEVGTGALMFGLAASMSNDLGCTASQYVRRNAGNTAFECGTAAGGITDVVLDTTPQLGGALDTNGFGIELGTANTDTTLTRSSAGNAAIEGNVIYRAAGTDVALADGGTGASLTDPNADRIGFWDDSAGAFTWLTPGTGLTITNTTIDASAGGKSIAVFRANDNEPPASNYATLDTRNGHNVLDFDTTTQETAIFSGVVPLNYGTSGFTVKVYSALTSATTGTLGWVAGFERIDAGTLDIDADSFAADQTGTAATVPGTSGVTMVHTISFSNAQIDGLVAGDAFRLKLRRDVANDNAAGDAEMLRVLVEMQ